MPRGRLVIAQGGRGPTSLALARRVRVGHSHVTIRVACVPADSRFKLVDSAGKTVLSGGCSGKAVYGTSFTADRNDLLIRVTFESQAVWKIAVWTT